MNDNLQGLNPWIENTMKFPETISYRIIQGKNKLLDFNAIPLLILLLFWMSPLQAQNTPRSNDAEGDFIDTHQIVPISNSQQYIRIKGSPSNPVFLFLAGGPGDSVTDRMEQMFSLLSEEFLVVLWDIRGVGQTAKLKNPAMELTQAVIESDTRVLVEYLLERFHKDRLYLSGFSWGSAPGFYMVANHPELLHAFVAVSPMIDQVRSEQMSISLLMQEAREEGHEEKISELSKVKVPFQNAEQLYYSRKWIFQKEGIRFGKKKSFRKYVENWSATWLDLFNEGIQTNLFESLPRTECPVFFIVGKKDYRTQYSIAEQYYNRMESPQKDFFLFEDGGHLIPYEQPKRFQRTVIDSILKK